MRCHARSRSARRSTGLARWIVRIADVASPLVFAGDAGGDFVHVGFCDYDGARSLQARNGTRLTTEVGQQRTCAAARGHAVDDEQIFHCDRDTVDQAASTAVA